MNPTNPEAPLPEAPLPAPGQRIMLLNSLTPSYRALSGERGTVYHVAPAIGSDPARFSVLFDDSTHETLWVSNNYRLVESWDPAAPWKQFEDGPFSPYLYDYPTGEGPVSNRPPDELLIALGIPPRFAAEVDSSALLTETVANWGWETVDEGETIRFQPVPLHPDEERPRGQDVEFLRRIAFLCCRSFMIDLQNLDTGDFTRFEWTGEHVRISHGRVLWKAVCTYDGAEAAKCW
jgi:hypothetical protein